MRLIQLVNFRKDGNGISVGTNNNFICNFNKPIIIPPKSSVCLVHAEINNTANVAVDTGVEYTSDDAALTADLTEETIYPQELVYISIPTLPIQSMQGQAEGGKGRETTIIAPVRSNNNDQIFNTEISVDLHNDHDLVLTQMEVQILDTDLDLKVFGAETGFRQTIVLGIKSGCDCKGQKYAY